MLNVTLFAIFVCLGMTIAELGAIRPDNWPAFRTIERGTITTTTTYSPPEPFPPLATTPLAHEPGNSSTWDKRHNIPLSAIIRGVHDLPDTSFHISDGPFRLEHIRAEDVTPEWKERGARHEMEFPVSIFHPPNPAAAAKHNTGYIMVAVTTCCHAWNMTRRLLTTLASLPDPIHVVVFDDNSKDGSVEAAAALGFPVFTTAHMSGNTANMNLAWKYFTSYDGLQSLFVMNNDIGVSAGAFSRLHRSLMLLENPGVMGPMSTRDGVPGIARQSCESEVASETYYNGQRPPTRLNVGLPETTDAYSAWLVNATSHLSERQKAFRSNMLMGFLMGYRKDHPIAKYRDNILLRGSKNLHQETFLFNQWKVPAYVCSDVFAYHQKAATLVGGKPVEAVAEMK